MAGLHLCRRRKFVFTGTVWGLGGVDDFMAQTIKNRIGCGKRWKTPVNIVKFQGRGN